MGDKKKKSLKKKEESEVSEMAGSSGESDAMDFEDEDVGESEDEVQEPDASGKRKKFEQTILKAKKSKKENVKPPTAEELVHLRETENLFQSNLFRLQIDEMIKEVKPKKSCRNSLKAYVNKLSSALSQTDIHYNKNIGNWLDENNIKFPINIDDKFKTQKFIYVKPKKVLTVGSFANGTAFGHEFSIDIAVVMPKEFFSKKDHLERNYVAKRALYLCAISNIILNNSDINPKEKIQFWTKTGDPIKPVLTYKSPYYSNVDIIISAIPDRGIFENSTFSLEKTNLDPDNSSPYFNSGVLEDIVLEENEETKKVFESCQSIKDAIILIGVWLKQRNLCDGYGGINMHIINMLMVYLYQNQTISKNMSSYQIIRHVWLFVSKGDWTKNGISFSKNQNLQSSEFHSSFPVVFVDPSGYFNLTFRISNLTYLKFKSESELALKYLNEPQINSFRALFMRKMNFIEQYDHVLSFTDPEVIKRTKNIVPDARLNDYSNHLLPLFCELLTDFLLKGLSNRIISMDINLTKSSKWDLGEENAAFSIQDVLLFGFKLNPETALAVIERGPDPTTPEGKEFKTFWGELCELRRFRDSEVSESVLWGKSGDPLCTRRLIVQKIVVYILKNKLGINNNSFTYIADQLSPLVTNNLFPSEKNEESCQAVHHVYEKFTHQLRDLQNLPLNITKIHCISPVYRFTEVFPPLPANFSSKGPIVAQDVLKKCPAFIKPIEVVIQMASDRHWPDDFNAGKRLIAAFYCNIASALEKQYNLVCKITVDHLDVYKDGYVFRVYLGYGKAIALLKEQMTDIGVRIYRDTQESVRLEKKFINLPKISGAIYGLSQMYSAFGVASCLAKRWISSQLFDESLFPEVVTELLMANLFLSPQPFSCPTQPLPAFLRFLNLLATTNWNVEPIIVNFNNLITKENQIEIEQLFNKNRASQPPMFLATSYDMSGSLWTKENPSLPTLVRLAKLASTSLKILEIHLTTFKTHKKIKSVFTPPMSAYNVRIQLKKSTVARFIEGVSCAPMGNKVLKAKKLSKSMPFVNFNPAEIYFEKLKANYGDQALFFYDVYGGKEIGVVFKPQYLKTIEFKTSQVGGRKPVEIEGKINLAPDMESMIEGFRILGKDIVKDIILKE